MAPVFLFTEPASYCILSLQRMIKYQKENRGKCADCPFQGAEMCR